MHDYSCDSCTQYIGFIVNLFINELNKDRYKSHILKIKYSTLSYALFVVLTHCMTEMGELDSAQPVYPYVVVQFYLYICTHWSRALCSFLSSQVTYVKTKPKLPFQYCIGQCVFSPFTTPKPHHTHHTIHTDMHIQSASHNSTSS